MSGRWAEIEASGRDVFFDSTEPRRTIDELSKLGVLAFKTSDAYEIVASYETHEQAKSLRDYLIEHHASRDDKAKWSREDAEHEIIGWQHLSKAALIPPRSGGTGASKVRQKIGALGVNENVLLDIEQRAAAAACAAVRLKTRRTFTTRKHGAQTRVYRTS